MPRSKAMRADPADRRASLIEAAALCLAERGAAGTSVRAVCRRAGVSAGLLTHYFDGIDELIAETYKSLGAKVSEAVAQAVEAAGPDPRARLQAYVTANFRPPVLDPQLLGTWLAFWSMVKTNPRIAQVHRENYAQFRSGIELLLGECWAGAATDREIHLGAVAISAMIDGLWLELCLDPSSYSADEATGLALRWVDTLVDG